MKRKIIQWLMILSLIFPLFGGSGGIAYAADESAEQGVQVSDLLGHWSGWAYKGISDIQKTGKGKYGTNKTIRDGFSKGNAFMVWSFMSPGSKGTSSSLTGSEISYLKTNVTYKSLVGNMPSNGKSKYLNNYVKPMFMYRYVLEQNGLLSNANNTASNMFTNIGRMASGLALYAVILADKIVQSAFKLVLGLVATLNPFVGLTYLTGNESVLSRLDGKSTKFTDKTAIKHQHTFSISNIWSSIAGKKQNDGNGLVAIYKALVAITIVIYVVLMVVGVGKAIMMGGENFGKSIGKTISKYLSRIIILFAGPILMGLIGAYLINKVAGMGVTSASTQTSSIIYGNFVNTQQWAVNSRFALPDVSESGVATDSKNGKGKNDTDSIRNLATSGHLYVSTDPSNLTKQYILQLNAKNAGLEGASLAMGGKKNPSFGQISKDLIGPYMMGSTFSRQDLDGAMIASISKDKKRAYDESEKSVIGQSKVFTYSNDDLKYDSFERYLTHLANGDVVNAANGSSAKANAEKIYTYTYGGDAGDKKGVYNALFISDGGLTIGKTKKGTKYYKQTAVTSKNTGSSLAPGTNASLAGLSTAGAMNLLSVNKSNSGTSYEFPVSMVGGQTGATDSLTRTVSLTNVNNGFEGLCKIVLIVLKAIFGISITVCVLVLLANSSLKSVMDTFEHGLQILKGDIKAIQIMLKDMIGLLLQMLLGFMLIIATNSISDIIENLINNVTGAFVPSGTAIISHGVVMGAGVSTAIVALSYIIQAAAYFWLIHVIFKDFNHFMRAVARMFDGAIEKMDMNAGRVGDPALTMIENGENKIMGGIGDMIGKKDAEDKRKADLDNKLNNIDDDDNANALRKAIDDGNDKSKHGESEIAQKAKEKSDKLKEKNEELARKHQDIEDRLKDATNPQEIKKLNDEKKANEDEQEANEAKMKKLGEIGNRAAQHKEDADKVKSTLGGRLKQTINPNYADAKATYEANKRDLDKALDNKQISPAQYAKAKQALNNEYRKQTAAPLAKLLAKKALTGGGLASEELLRKAINNPNGALAKAMDMATGGQFSEALKQGKPVNRAQRQEMLQKLAKGNAPLSRMTAAANSFVPKKQAAEAAKNLSEAKAGAESVAASPLDVIDQAQAAVKNGTATDAQKNLVRNVKRAGRQAIIVQAQKAVKNGTATEAQKALAKSDPQAVIAQAQAAVKNGTATDLQKDIVREVAKADPQTVIAQAQEAVANGKATDIQKEIAHEVAQGEPQAVIAKAQEAVANGSATTVQTEMVHELSKMPQALTSSTETIKAVKSGDKAQAANAIVKENKVMLDQAVKEGRTNDAIAIMKRINNEASQADIDVPQNIGHTEIQKMIADVGRADAFRKGDMVSQSAVGKLAAAGIAPTSIHKANVPQSQNTVLEAAFGQEVHIPRTGGELITNEMIAKAPPETRAGLQEMQKNGVKIQLTGNALKQKPNIKEVKNAVIGLTTGYQGNTQQALGGLDQRIVQAQANGENIVQAVKSANIKTLAANAAGANVAKDQARIVASYQTPAAVLAAKSVTSPTSPIGVDLETAYQLHGSAPSAAAAEKAWGAGGGVMLKGLEQSIVVKREALKANKDNKELKASLNAQVHHLTVLRNMAQSGSMPITQEEVNAVAASYQAIDPSQTQETIKYTAGKAVQVGKAIQSQQKVAASSSSVVGASTDVNRFRAAPKKHNTLREIQDNAVGGTIREKIQKKNDKKKKKKIASEDSIFNGFRVDSNPAVAKYEAERAANRADDYANRFKRQREEAAKKRR